MLLLICFVKSRRYAELYIVTYMNSSMKKSTVCAPNQPCPGTGTSEYTVSGGTQVSSLSMSFSHWDFQTPPCGSSGEGMKLASAL